MDSDRKSLRIKWQKFYEDLYRAYPLHQDFGGGFTAFLNLMEEGRTDPQYVMEKAQAYASNVSDLKFVPHLKTWLNNRRFDDEDIFTDQAVAQREWLRAAWRRSDARAVCEKYGFIYQHPPVPKDVEDVAAWHEDQRKLWISKIAKHILDGEPYPE